MTGYRPVFWYCDEHRHSTTRESSAARAPSARCLAAERQIGRAGYLSEDALHHGVHQARFPQARLADDRDRLTRALLRLFPAIVQQVELVIPRGERGQAGSRRDLDRIAMSLRRRPRTRLRSVETGP